MYEIYLTAEKAALFDPRHPQFEFKSKVDIRHIHGEHIHQFARILASFLESQYHPDNDDCLDYFYRYCDVFLRARRFIYRYIWASEARDFARRTAMPNVPRPHKKCVVCELEPRSVVTRPCLHDVMCVSCEKLVRKLEAGCPYCHVQIV